MIELGGNIELAGFSDLDYSELIVVKKIVGNYARNMSDATKMDKLSVTLKEIHEREKSEKFELKAHCDCDGKIFGSECVDRNLFVALDSVLKKVLAQSLKK